MDLDGLDARTDEHMKLQDIVSDALADLGLKPLSWRAPEPIYDLAFELDSMIVVVEVKTLGTGAHSQQMRLGLGQLLEYRHRLSEFHQRDVRGLLVASQLIPAPWPAIFASADAAVASSAELRAGLSQAICDFRT